MAMLGISLFVTMIFLSILLWVQRRFHISAIIPLVTVAIMWLVFLGGLSGEGFTLSKELFERGGIYKVISWFIYNWSGRPIALVGIVPFALFGAILGLLVYEAKSLQDYRYNLFFFFLLFTGFIIFLYGAAIVSRIVNDSSYGHTFMYYRLILFSFIFILFVITGVLLYFIDIKPARQGIQKEEAVGSGGLKDDHIYRRKVRRGLNSFRRIGRIFFTLYLWQAFVLELFSLVRERQFFYSLNLGFLGLNGETLNMLFIALVLIFWILFFIFAHFLHFKGTVEYVIYLLFALRFTILKKEGLVKSEDPLGWTDLYLFYLDF